MTTPFQVCGDAESLSRSAAERILDALVRKPAMLFCAAAGATPSRTYELLAARAAREPALFRALRLLKLDEWGGLPMSDFGTCEHQIQTTVVAPLGIAPERYIGFDSSPSDVDAECARVRRYIVEKGPIDLCLLGLGLNGHLGMNEPAAFLRPGAHVATLTESTLRHPMLGSAGSRPSFGLTLGMAEILGSREILLLVSGTSKREPLRRLRQAEVTPEFPASFLWLHPNWTVLCDDDAAGAAALPP